MRITVPTVEESYRIITRHPPRYRAPSSRRATVYPLEHDTNATSSTHGEHDSMAVTTPAAATDVAPSATRLYERTFIALVGALALILSSLPILAGHLLATPERQFVGIVYNMPDHAQYFAWMRDLARAPLAPNRLTPEPNAPAFFNLLWWTVGRIGALTGLEYAALWSGLRIVAAVAVLDGRVCLSEPGGCRCATASSGVSSLYIR